MKIIKETNISCIVETKLTATELQFILDNRNIPAKVYYTNKANEKLVSYSSINYRMVLYCLELL